MPDGLYPVVLAEVERTVDTRAGRQRPGIILRDAEVVERVRFHGLHLVGIGIVRIFRLAEEPVLRIAYARVDAYVFEQLEVRQAYAEIVGHAVLEFVREFLVLQVEFRGLEVDLVLQCGIVGKADLLVELLLAHTVLFLERVDRAHGEGHVRQGEGV